MQNNQFGFETGDLETILAVIKQYPAVEQAIIFGSRAKGNYKKGSDVDIALKGDINFNIISRINSTLNEETNLPYKFDIINYAQIDNLALSEHINRVGIVFYLDHPPRN
jgi:predicted nucleotidyltransferase